MSKRKPSPNQHSPERLKLRDPNKYRPATVRPYGNPYPLWELRCTEGHAPLVRVYPVELGAQRGAVRHLKLSHPEVGEQLPPRGGARRLQPLNPITAKVDVDDLITLREATELLGLVEGKRPGAAVEAMLRRGKLVAYTDPEAPTSTNTSRFVLRKAVLVIKAQGPSTRTFPRPPVAVEDPVC